MLSYASFIKIVYFLEYNTEQNKPDIQNLRIDFLFNGSNRVNTGTADSEYNIVKHT